MSEESRHCGVVIVGGGILGTTLAYWLGSLYDGADILVIEKEAGVAYHSSGRNTGVVHRPFYLDPVKKKVFATTAQLSYPLWRTYAEAKKLPWNEVGTLEVALTEEQVPRLKTYYEWALKNGMTKEEVELLSPAEVRRLEPGVRSAGGLLCKTDTAVDYGAFTRQLQQDAQALGVHFLLGSAVRGITLASEQVVIHTTSGVNLKTRLLINCAGGGSLKLAHLFGVAKEFFDVNFRGEYWVVKELHRTLASRNLYSVPRHHDFPFLDPHWIVRASGQVEIGPTAVPVVGPQAYQGFFENWQTVKEKLLRRSLGNVGKLLINPEFLKLSAEEWRSSLFRGVLVKRVQEFLPSFEAGHLLERGLAGIRSMLVDQTGNFVKEAKVLSTPQSLHVLNYNSPGATGAPAYAAYLLKQLEASGRLTHLRPRAEPAGLWGTKI